MRRYIIDMPIHQGVYLCCCRYDNAVIRWYNTSNAIGYKHAMQQLTPSSSSARSVSLLMRLRRSETSTANSRSGSNEYFEWVDCLYITKYQTMNVLRPIYLIGPQRCQLDDIGVASAATTKMLVHRSISADEQSLPLLLVSLTMLLPTLPVLRRPRQPSQ